MKSPSAEFIKYTISSGFSLGIDFFGFLLLTSDKSLLVPVAATISYVLGLGTAYLLMRYWVFKSNTQKIDWFKEFILFISSGILGLSITFLTSWISIFLWPEKPILAKIIAVIISFFSVYLFRKRLVF